MSAPPERITVLTSVSKLYATKRLRRDRKTGKLIKNNYGTEKYFKVQTAGLTGFDHLCRCLEVLTTRPFSFVIRGEPLPSANREKTRRLVHDDPETGDAAAFADASRSWFAVDIDKVKRPVAIDPITDPEGVIEHLIGLLPPELYDASCWWQFTCSQSLPECADTLSARLWFWLREPLDDASLTRWALSANKAFGGKLVDASIYRAVQPHYVADPIFEDGVRDPLPRRHGVRRGLDTAVTLVIPEPSVDDPYVDGGGYVGLGIEGHLAEIGRTEFRAPMLSAIAVYFTANGADADPEPIKQRVREAIDRADPGGRSETDLDRYRSDRHLNDIIGWVRARERANPRSVVPPQTPGEFLKALASSVPIGNQRAKAVRAVAQHAFRQKYLNVHLAVSFVESWNQVHCTPPLPIDQVRAITGRIITALANREINTATIRDGGGEIRDGRNRHRVCDQCGTKNPAHA